MQAYLKHLRESTKDLKPTTKESTENYTPLVDQITKLMSILPPNMKQRDWTMNDLLNRLEGKFRERPSPMGVARALRQLGWKRCRDYSNKGGGIRVWKHPDYTS